MDIGNLLAKTSEDLSVRRAFGTAYEKDGMLIIPVAIVARRGGGGTARTRVDLALGRRYSSCPGGRSQLRKSMTSAANSAWCWKRKPWAESG
jgi:hypothetical protein